MRGMVVGGPNGGSRQKRCYPPLVRTVAPLEGDTYRGVPVLG